MSLPRYPRATLRPLAFACTFAIAPLVPPSAVSAPTGDAETSSSEVTRLISQLNDRDAKTRSAATYALRSLGQATPEILSALEQNLDAAAEQTRSVAASALMTFGPEGEHILRQRVDRAGLPLQQRLEAVMALRSRLEGLKDPALAKAMESMLEEIRQLESPPSGIVGEGPFENAIFASEEIEKDWLLMTAGSRGEMAHEPDQQREVGGGSLRLTKLDAGGEVSLRSKRTLRVKRGTSPTVRLFFRGDNTPANSTLQIFFENARTGSLSIGEVYRGHTAQSQTLLRNSPPGTWLKRIAEAPKRKTDEEYYIRVTLSGNPATVWLSDISAPATPYAYHYPPGMETFPGPERASDPALTGSAEAPLAPHLEKTATAPAPRTRIMAAGKPLPPILYFIMRSNFGDYAGMSELGQVPFMVCSVPMNDLDGSIYPPYTPVWTEPGKFDFTTPLSWLDDTARKAPDALLFLNFHLAWPRAWIKEHPGEEWINIEGKKAFGSSIHMRGFTDELPSGGDTALSNTDAASYRWWPSPYSEAALKSAEEAIQRFMAEVKQKPYAHRIAGCFISGGHDGQFFTGWPDYSVPAQKAFTAWLKREYSSDAALQEAWHDTSVTLATATIPDTRLAEKRTDLFLNPASDQRFVDQRRFMAEQGFVIRDRLAAAFKKTLPHPALGLTWQLGGGRGQGSDTLLPDARGIDVIIPQAAYDMRQPGYLGGLRASLGSLSRYGKLAVKELDLRTWLRAGGAEIPANRLGTAFSPEAFSSIFRKEAAEMIGAGHGFWLFDIGSSHFRDPEMLKTIGESVRAYKELELENPAPFQPEVAFAWSSTSSDWIADNRNSGNIFSRLERHNPAVLKSMGLPYDEVDLRELLKREDALPYKLIILPDAWRLTEAHKTAIAEKLRKNNATLVWNYAAGYLTDDGPSDQATSSLAGMAVRSEPVTSLPEIRFKEGSSPITTGLSDTPGLGEASNRTFQLKNTVPKGFMRFVVEDENAIPLATYSDGKTAIGLKKQEGWTSVYSGMLGTLDPRLLNRLARDAGAHIFTETPVGLVFNGRFLSLHGLQNGKVSLRLPEASRVVDFDTGQEIGSGTEVAIELKAGETRWFRVEPLKNLASKAAVQ